MPTPNPITYAIWLAAAAIWGAIFHRAIHTTIAFPYARLTRRGQMKREQAWCRTLATRIEKIAVKENLPITIDVMYEHLWHVPWHKTTGFYSVITTAHAALAVGILEFQDSRHWSPAKTYSNQRILKRLAVQVLGVQYKLRDAEMHDAGLTGLVGDVPLIDFKAEQSGESKIE